MWQTVIGLAPLALVAAGLGAWTAVDVARSLRSPRENPGGGGRG